MSPHRQTKDDLAEKVKRLEEKLRKLRASADAPASVKADGLAEGIVTSLGKMVPGLQKLIDIAAGSPEFHERLASIDDEIQKRFKDKSLNRAALGVAGGLGRRQMGIPPSIRRGRSGSGRTVASTGTAWTATNGKKSAPRRRRRCKVHVSPETPEQLPVDVFDEGDHLVVLAEAHSLKRQCIDVCLDGAVLVISIDAPHRKGAQRIALPCEVRGKPDVSLTKGVLKILLNKAKNT